MSRTGNCYVNAVTESFGHTRIADRPAHQDYTHAAARMDIFRYLEDFHSTLGYLLPMAFAQRSAQSVVLVGG